jgi:hypothetical protein
VRQAPPSLPAGAHRRRRGRLGSISGGPWECRRRQRSSCQSASGRPIQGEPRGRRDPRAEALRSRSARPRRSGGAPAGTAPPTRRWAGSPTSRVNQPSVCDRPGPERAPPHREERAHADRVDGERGADGAPARPARPPGCHRP